MRVALYAGAFKENQDGATRSLYQLIRSMQANGMQVGVWSYNRVRESGAGIACPTDDHTAHFQACRRLCECPSPHAGLRPLPQQDSV